MAASGNTRLMDTFTRRQLRTSRVATGLWRRVWGAMAMLETEVLAALKVADPFAVRVLRTRQRLLARVLEETLTPLITARYQQMAGLMAEALSELATTEAAQSLHAVNAVLGSHVLTTVPPPRTVQRRVLTTLFPAVTGPTDQSAPHAEWWERQAATLLQRLRDHLRVSAGLGESLDAAVQRIRGTVPSGLRDGLMERARGAAEQLVRTEVTHAVSQAHAAVAAANGTAQIVLIHSSILDAHTSYPCLSRHGLQFDAASHAPIGHRLPYAAPPLHPHCRSVLVLGQRAGGRLVPESGTAWLRRQGTAYQDEVLGPTRGQLFRAGTLRSLRDLVEGKTGRPLTLAELREEG
jgi:hypothetical protein